MDEPTRKTRNAPARETLRRWSAQARPGVLAGLGLQLIGTLGWIGLSFGISQAVAALALGTDGTAGLVLAACAIVIRAIAGWLAENMLSAAGRRLTQSARTELFEALAQSGPGWLVGEASGARVSQLTDRTARLAGYSSRWQPGMGMAMIAPILVVLAVATQSWLAAALLLTSVLILPVFIWLTASGTAATARAQQAALDQLSGGFQSRAAQVGLIRAFRATRREAAHLAADAETLRQRTMAILRVAFLTTAVLEFFASVSIALVAVYVGFKLLGVFPFSTGEEVTLAEGLAALLLAPEFFAPIRRLSTLHHDRADAVAAADFLSRWLDSRPSGAAPRAPRLAAAPVIAFRSARLGWPDGTVAVENLTLTARPGQITVLTGPSGAGKSTALLALLGHACTLDGQILIDGTPLGPRKSLAESVAYVGQTPWLMEGSLRANIAVAAPDAPAGALERAAHLSGVLDFATPEHGGLDRPLARFGAGLSGGQRLRIALARAILRDAPILLLDEPTAHLDAEAETDLLARLRDLAPGRTVLVASHSEPVIRCADVRVMLPGHRQESLP